MFSNIFSSMLSTKNGPIFLLKITKYGSAKRNNKKNRLLIAIIDITNNIFSRKINWNFLRKNKMPNMRATFHC